MKFTGKFLFKVILSGLISVLILELFTSIYSYIPIHITQENGATDYKWVSGSRWNNFTEGFGRGVIDSNGYNNQFAYDELDYKPEILLMGASQMEAFNVVRENNTASNLMKELNSKNKKQSVYNIGISAHYFLRLINNLDNALQAYTPKSYVILQMENLTFSERDINKSISQNYDKLKSYDKGIIFQLQKSSLLRLLRRQVIGLFKFSTRYKNYDNNPVLKSSVIINRDIINNNYKKYKKLSDYIKCTCDKYNITPIIVYAPKVNIDSNGNLLAITNRTDEELSFIKSLESNNILFLDLTDSFNKYYYSNLSSVYGFNNTQIGQGHLNKNGHKLIAHEIANLIKKHSRGEL